MSYVQDNLGFRRFLNRVVVTGSRSLGTSFSQGATAAIFVWAVVRCTNVAAADTVTVNAQAPFATTVQSVRFGPSAVGAIADLQLAFQLVFGETYGVTSTLTGTGTAVLQTWLETQLV